MATAKGIFISYRRADSEGQSGRLYDDLVAAFGKDRVFFDVSGIKPGQDFRLAIDDQVASCSVLLAVIGKDWLQAADTSGRTRLDDPHDYVRIEISSALKRNIPVVPVLVRGAIMPGSSELPEDLVNLSYRNAVELSHGRWASDVQILVDSLSSYIEGSDTAVTTTKKMGNRSAFLPDLFKHKTQHNDRLSVPPTKKRVGLICLILATSVGAYVIVSTYVNERQVDRNNIQVSSEEFAATQPPPDTDLIPKKDIHVILEMDHRVFGADKLVLLLNQRGYSAQFNQVNGAGESKVLLFGNNVPLPYVKDIARASMALGVNLCGIYMLCTDSPDSKLEVTLTPNPDKEKKAPITLDDVDMRGFSLAPGC